MKERILITKSADETHALGEHFGSLLKAHTVILMDGDESSTLEANLGLDSNTGDNQNMTKRRKEQKVFL